ncbi:hypothetical protein MPER_03078, partial [Moniliophthora perniciosa FA553]
NWRAFVAIAISLPINLPGLMNVMNPKTIHIGGLRYAYKASWLIAFSMGFTTYYLLNLLFPAKDAMSSRRLLAEDALEEQEKSESMSYESGRASKNLSTLEQHEISGI